VICTTEGTIRQFMRHRNIFMKSAQGGQSGKSRVLWTDFRGVFRVDSSWNAGDRDWLSPLIRSNRIIIRDLDAYSNGLILRMCFQSLNHCKLLRFFDVCAVADCWEKRHIHLELSFRLVQSTSIKYLGKSTSQKFTSVKVLKNSRNSYV